MGRISRFIVLQFAVACFRSAFADEVEVTLYAVPGEILEIFCTRNVHSGEDTSSGSSITWYRDGIPFPATLVRNSTFIIDMYNSNTVLTSKLTVNISLVENIGHLECDTLDDRYKYTIYKADVLMTGMVGQSKTIGCFSALGGSKCTWRLLSADGSQSNVATYSRKTGIYEIKGSLMNRANLNPNNFSLTIYNLETFDSGAYECIPWGVVKLKVVQMPDIVVTPRLKVIGENDNATFTCSLSYRHSGDGPQQMLVNWLNIDGHVITRDSWHSVEVDSASLTSTLRLVHASRYRSGVYTCRVSHPYIKVSKSAAANLTVFVPVEIELLPRSTIYIQNTSLPDHLLLQCLILNGSPLPQITWLKDSTIIDDAERIHVVNDGQVLLIVPFEDVDAGEYRCSATNRANLNTSTVDATVLVLIRAGNETRVADGNNTLDIQPGISRPNSNPENESRVVGGNNTLDTQLVGDTKHEAEDGEVERKSEKIVGVLGAFVCLLCLGIVVLVLLLVHRRRQSSALDRRGQIDQGMARPVIRPKDYFRSNQSLVSQVVKVTYSDGHLKVVEVREEYSSGSTRGDLIDGIVINRTGRRLAIEDVMGQSYQSALKKSTSLPDIARSPFPSYSLAGVRQLSSSSEM